MQEINHDLIILIIVEADFLEFHSLRLKKKLHHSLVAQNWKLLYDLPGQAMKECCCVVSFPPFWHFFGIGT